MARAGRRAGRWVAAVAMVLVVAGVAFWAGRVTLGSPVAAPDEVAIVEHVVAEATVGRSLSLNVTVEQPFVLVATNGLAGTVTAVSSGELVEVGDMLYEVDTVPVRAVAGDVPFWRPLSADAAGEDVSQLQAALAELGYLAGQPDGRFGFATGQAVRAWQRDVGLPVTGVVALGELVAVPSLPARLRLDERIVTGARLGGGEPAVSAPSGEIGFFLVVSPNQAGLIPPDAVVTMEHGELTWRAVLGESQTGEGGNIRFALKAPSGGLVCGSDCEALPAAERTSLRARVTVVPEVSGPAVPVAAVRTDPDGTAWVVLADGTRQEVTVLGSSGGVAVVDGLAAGERVRVLGGEDGGVPAPRVAPGDNGEPGGEADGSGAGG
jgi:peptidoglycan hydrolase-like protein with peptidoglycan-binding domain